MDRQTTREWGDKRDLNVKTKKRVDGMWDELGIQTSKFNLKRI